jgi:putative phosphoribosyl transferase
MNENTRIFATRQEAAEELSLDLAEFKNKNPLILGIPRGAVPMSRIVAERLNGDLDIILVHKIGYPAQPEFAIGSVSEDGDILLGDGGRRMGMTIQDLEPLARQELEALKKKRAEFAPDGRKVDPAGRIVIIVDDGIATGATMEAAIKSLLRHNAKKIVVATPVASPEAAKRLQDRSVETHILQTPEIFYAVGQFYEEFPQVTDEEVKLALRGYRNQVNIDLGEKTILHGFLDVPNEPRGVIIFAHGSGSGRLSPRNQFVARRLNQSGFVTLLADLLTESEAQSRSNVFDIELLTNRLSALAHWVGHQPRFAMLPIGLFGASTGAGAAIECAAHDTITISSVVSRGGRPDLAPSIGAVEAPTLLIVGSNDEGVLELNQQALEQLNCEKKIEIVPGATHLFEESGTLEQVAELATDWFSHHMPVDVSRKSRPSLGTDIRPRA